MMKAQQRAAAKQFAQDWKVRGYCICLQGGTCFEFGGFVTVAFLFCRKRYLIPKRVVIMFCSRQKALSTAQQCIQKRGCQCTNCQ